MVPDGTFVRKEGTRMTLDDAAVLRNEFASLIENEGEKCLCREDIVSAALELEEKLRSLEC